MADTPTDDSLVTFLRNHHIWCTARDGRFEQSAARLAELSCLPASAPQEPDDAIELREERIRRRAKQLGDAKSDPNYCRYLNQARQEEAALEPVADDDARIDAMWLRNRARGQSPDIAARYNAIANRLQAKAPETD